MLLIEAGVNIEIGNGKGLPASDSSTCSSSDGKGAMAWVAMEEAVVMDIGVR